MSVLTKVIDEHKDEPIDIRDFYNYEYDNETDRYLDQ
jgi:hypothetical protein